MEGRNEEGGGGGGRGGGSGEGEGEMSHVFACMHFIEK